MMMVLHTAIPIIIEGQFQVFQRFSSSKLVLETVESCFVALNYYEKGSSFANRLAVSKFFYLRPRSRYTNIFTHTHIAHVISGQVLGGFGLLEIK